MIEPTTRSMVDRALEAHERANLERVTIARTIVFLVILLWLWANYGAAIALENTPIIGLFIALGIATYLLTREQPGRLWPRAVVLAFEALLLGYTLLAPGRTYPDEWPWPMVLRHQSFLYFFVLLALATIMFRPVLVLWAGFCICAVWASATWLIVQQPEAIGTMADLEGSSMATFLERYLDPHYVHIDDLVVRLFCAALVTVILALGAQRARKLVHEQAEAARERTNLARYVAPKMVERLATADRPLAIARNGEVAVLFADIQGFTRIAEGLGPEATMSLLAEFHGKMAQLVFAHDGTLDKFIGDGLMATFGSPEPAADDALRALRCGQAMLAEIEAWNATRIDRGMAPIAIGVGMHFGPVTMGDIGGAGRFEFAVIGDTVNVASRLERLTRMLGRDLLVSGDLLARVPPGSVDPALVELLGKHGVRGRSEVVDVLAIGSGRLSLTHVQDAG